MFAFLGFTKAEPVGEKAAATAEAVVDSDLDLESKKEEARAEIRELVRGFKHNAKGILVQKMHRIDRLLVALFREDEAKREEFVRSIFTETAIQEMGTAHDPTKQQQNDAYQIKTAWLSRQLGWGAPGEAPACRGQFCNRAPVIPNFFESAGTIEHYTVARVRR